MAFIEVPRIQAGPIVRPHTNSIADYEVPHQQLWPILRHNTRRPGIEVIKLEYNLRPKIKHSDWLLADTCPQAANHYALF